MTCHDDILTRWADVILAKTDRRLFSRSASNVFAIDDVAYSYGTHFELAELIRDHRGRPSFFLLNGDLYSVSTSRHQRTVRNVVERTGLPYVIIPYSVLSSAGIDRGTLRIIDVLPEGNTRTTHHSETLPAGASWVRRPTMAHVDRSPEELDAAVSTHRDRFRREADDYVRRITRALMSTETYWDIERMETYGARARARAESFSTDDLSSYERREYREIGTHLEAKWDRKRADGETFRHAISVERNEHGEAIGFTWETYRHWLGESVVRGKVARHRWVTCDHATVSDIATHEERCAAGTCWERRSRNGRPMERGRTERTTRTATFLSGFDIHETRPLYFFCELPRSARPTTVAEAYETLKPDAVKLAETAGRSVERQGDIFAIPLTITKRELSAMGARFEKMGQLLSTNHVATEVAYVGNVTYARGVLWHRPAFRAPDHGRVAMGDRKAWHAIVKNTVPIVR